MLRTGELPELVPSSDESTKENYLSNVAKALTYVLVNVTGVLNQVSTAKTLNEWSK